ncbi:MAG: hypothetical protein A2832_02145 [Candidatus Zambryskibacteria bacterium RIFCSPHIGHO2_01_FULL_44_22b]|uniref:Addiction module toxin, HicA family n=2 Tax=Candidatus Zambryskiibacteriota TaxID=1817925 RepID=A0A1G2SY35_9BACT|nr:MAG: hypothetical protein A2832_02145 [Candidatus Zambryskibacteria bacterium RIFCSPHIGHO2_01_FULL_44_22b]OHB05657.1 MAG: hypothetical protein A3B16_02515 [Candidatus Zambryskibacteria bacterium RIFCSPLOWO2_01_FULL_45_43]
MPKLRVVSGRQLVKFFEKQGFELEYGKGSHCKMIKFVGEQIQELAIPLHKEIARGTLKAIFSQAAHFIPVEELRKYFYTK